MTRIVASMITRNEMGRYLPLAVENLLGFCEEVRVLDDRSDDGTFEWLAEHAGVNVIRNLGPGFYEHEGRARQALYEHTLKGRPDYVLAIDADEFVGDQSIVHYALKSRAPVYSLGLVEIWGGDAAAMEVRIDGMWRKRNIPVLYRPDPTWTIRDRQLACGREPEQVARAAGRAHQTGSLLLHLGWARRSEREARAARYDVHDGGKFHADRHLQSILWQERRDRRLRLSSQPWPVGLRTLAPDIVKVING